MKKGGVVKTGGKGKRSLVSSKKPLKPAMARVKISVATFDTEERIRRLAGEEVIIKEVIKKIGNALLVSIEPKDGSLPWLYDDAVILSSYLKEPNNKAKKMGLE